MSKRHGWSLGAAGLAAALMVMAAPSVSEAECGTYVFSDAIIDVPTKQVVGFHVKDTLNPQRRKKKRTFPSTMGVAPADMKIKVALHTSTPISKADKESGCFMRVMVRPPGQASSYTLVRGTIKRSTYEPYPYVWTSEKSVYAYTKKNLNQEIAIGFQRGSKLNRASPAASVLVTKPLSDFKAHLYYGVAMPKKWKYHRERTVNITVCNSGFKELPGTKLALYFVRTRAPMRFRNVPALGGGECYRTKRSLAIRDITKRTYMFMLIGGLTLERISRYQESLNIGSNYVKYIPIGNIKFYKEFKVFHR